MTQTLTETKLLTFEEYRFYQSNDDRLYELYKGQLILIAINTNLHTRICDFLVYEMRNYLVSKNRDLIVGRTTGVRTEINSSRIPDMVICSRELWEILRQRAGGGILDFGETPRLVVEVTSDNWREDYVEKRREYALIQVPEYWIINPNKKVVLVLNYNPLNQEYEQQDFQPGSVLISREFPDLVLEVNTILSPPIVEDLMRVKQWQYQEVAQELKLEKIQNQEVAQQLELEKIQKQEVEQQLKLEKVQKQEVEQQLELEKIQKQEFVQELNQVEQQLKLEKEKSDRLLAKLKELGLEDS